MTTLRSIAVAAISVVIGSGIVAPSAADAAGNRVCHRDGNRLAPPVSVVESDGSKYSIYPGQCTPGDVPVFGFRPRYAGQRLIYRFTHQDTLRTCGYISSTQYCSTLGHDVDVVSSRYA